jgi:hypothetical protein
MIGRIMKLSIAMSLLFAGALVAQGPSPGASGPPDVIFHRPIDAAPSGVAAGVTFAWASGEMAAGDQAVKNAPYTGEAVTETVQTLIDGNRIQRKHSASLARDSEGRTRRSQKLGVIGNLVPANEAPELVFINDPVAGVHYVLNVKEKTANKLPVPPGGGFFPGTPGVRVPEGPMPAMPIRADPVDLAALRWGPSVRRFS